MDESTNVNTTEIAENTSQNTAKVISIINMKGGVGKTTLTINLAVEAAKAGKKVLVIDLDPQFNATQSLIERKIKLQATQSSTTKEQTDAAVIQTLENSFDFYSALSSQGRTVYSLFEQLQVDEQPKFFTPISERLDLVAGDLALASVGSTNVVNQQAALKIFFDNNQIIDTYDYVLIDNGPTWSQVLTAGSLLVSDYYLIPSKLEFYSSLGIDLLQTTIEQWSKTQQAIGVPIKLRPLGVTLMFTEDNKIESTILQTLKDNFSLDFFKNQLSAIPTAGSKFTIYDDMQGNGTYDGLLNQFGKLQQEIFAKINSMES